jgi:hypothetical protein
VYPTRGVGSVARYVRYPLLALTRVAVLRVVAMFLLLGIVSVVN